MLIVAQLSIIQYNWVQPNSTNSEHSVQTDLIILIILQCFVSILGSNCGLKMIVCFCEQKSADLLGPIY